MKRLIFLAPLLFAACSFAPLSIDVPDFFIASGSSASMVCYSKVTESIDVQFTSVSYEATTLYDPGTGLGDNSEIQLEMYGRESDPDPSSSLAVKCVSVSSADTLLSDVPLTLQQNVSKRVSVGGSELARLVTRSEYWLGGSLDDGTPFSLPGRIDFTEGSVKAFF